MSLIYFALIIIIFITLFIIKRNDKKENIIKIFAINTLIIFSYHILITFILNLFHLPSSITSLSICAVLFEGIMLFKIVKEKSIQKYYIRKQDIVFCIILLIGILLIGYIQYGFPMGIKYNVTDATAHYIAAKEFSNISDLLPHIGGNLDSLNYETFMTGAYVNLGILFKCFSCIIQPIDYYIINNIFEMFMLFVSGLLLYILLSKNESENEKISPNTIIKYLITILFLLGYPLLNMISGLQYLNIGLSMIMGIWIINSQEDKGKYFNIENFLLNLGLFFSYYFFVPVVYGAELLNNIRCIEKDGKKKFEIKNIPNLFTYIIPGIIGVYYFLIRPRVSGGMVPISAIGATAFDLTNILDFVLFIPFIIYYLIDKIKNKNYSFSFFIIILELLFVIGLWIAYILGIVSDYYYGKSLYLLWIIVFYTMYKISIKLIDKNKIIKIIIYSFLIVYCIFTVLSMINNKNYFFWNIYQGNYEEIVFQSKCLTSEEIFTLKNIENEYKTNVKTFVANSNSSAWWISIELSNYELIGNGTYIVGYEVDEWINKKAEGILINFKRMNEISDEKLKNVEILKNNDTVLIIQNN